MASLFNCVCFALFMLEYFGLHPYKKIVSDGYKAYICNIIMSLTWQKMTNDSKAKSDTEKKQCS